MLHQGEKIKVSCPAYLANGGAEQYSNVDDGFRIRPNTPLTYELEVMSCMSSNDHEKFNKENESWGIVPAVHKLKKAGKDGIDRIAWSGLKILKGTNTHDAKGNLRREGGGQSKGYGEEVTVIKPPVTFE